MAFYGEQKGFHIAINRQLTAINGAHIPVVFNGFLMGFNGGKAPIRGAKTTLRSSADYILGRASGSSRQRCARLSPMA